MDEEKNKESEDEDEEIEDDSKEPEKSKSNKETLTDKFRENPFIISTFVLGILSIILIVVLVGGSSITGNVVSENDIGQQLLGFYEANGATGLELDSVEELSGVYQVNFLYDGQIVPIFATKDGKFAGSLSPLVQQFNEPEPAQTDIQKSDKPVVELFIMTHCPYGTQAEKGLIPVIQAMGDTIHAKIRFIHYFMHEPEETETPRQICIRQEQSDKYLDYLTCFLEDGDSDRCLLETGIDITALATCVENDAENYYAEDSGLSQSYGVQGSPSLVINGQMISSSRSPDAYLQTICSAFNTAPELCETLELSSTTPSAMWGWDAQGADTSAQC